MEDCNDMLSVICPIYNEEKYIDKCINSILEQEFPRDQLEVIFVDGMSSDATRDIVYDYQRQFPFISLIDNPERIVPYAMNRGILASRGDIVMRLDAHASYPTNYFSTLTSKLVELKADNVGAPCRTDVLNKTNKGLAIKEVLSNRFGVGNSSFRTGVDAITEVDTVPFGCWNREVFDRYGLYDVRLVRNQDIELNKRIIRGGGHIYLIPETYCTYYAREKYYALAKNNYGNGKWNILTVFYTNTVKSLSLRHFVPLLLLMALILPLLASFIYVPIIWLSPLVLTCYLLGIGAVSIGLSCRKKLNFWYLLWAFITLHMSYGYGSLVGILKLPFVKK